MDKIHLSLLFFLLAIVIVVAGCTVSGGKKEIQPSFLSEVVHPEWSKNAVLYEVNVRQFTPEGTFNAFAEHLPRLKKLGVNVLWFMPVTPIGVKNRKEPLGSYYSVKDYMNVNPEFGTLDDFKKVITQAHDMGFHVLIDWVPNHSSWDNKLTVEHPDWYERDSTGNFEPPVGTDWTDVIQFDWSNKGLQDYMLNALKFWVDLGVDGFRVDFPGKTPVDFWVRVRTELSMIKPIFMLAENEDKPEFLEKGFDMNYSWELFHLMTGIAQGKDNVNSLRKYYRREKATYPSNVYRMVFLDNHDENSWNGTINSRLGDAQEAFAVFIFTTRGVPLLYNGQEVCLDKSLKFFEKDTINWDTCKLTPFYTNLVALKEKDQALWNGDFGGAMDSIPTSRDKKVFAYFREKGDNRIIVFLNLSKKSVAVKPRMKNLRGSYTDYFSGKQVKVPLTDSLRMGPWGYKVLTR